MPYAEPSSANNSLSDAVAAIKARNGDGDWREVLTATPRHRSVLLQLTPGTHPPTHEHPGGEEVFVIHEGTAEFDFGAGDLHAVGPGSVLYASAGQQHTFTVLGSDALLMMCFLSVNEPDDTVED